MFHFPGYISHRDFEAPNLPRFRVGVYPSSTYRSTGTCSRQIPICAPWHRDELGITSSQSSQQRCFWTGKARSSTSSRPDNPSAKFISCSHAEWPGQSTVPIQAIVTIHGWYFNLYPSYLSSMGGLKGKSKPETMVFPSKYGVVLWIFP
jgi:hypothetical protein